jgi:hypothetical protein
MTDDRSLERAARSWIEAGPTQAPDRAVEAALLRIQTTKQERDLRIPWRLPKMTTPARVAAAAVIGVLAIGGAVYLISPSGRSNVGVPGPSPTAPPSASAAPSPSAALVPGAAPATTLGDWQAMSDGAITGLFGGNEHIQLSIDWQDGLHTWIQTTAGALVLKSETLQAPAGEIDLRSNISETIGCGGGDLGRYSWSRSADGMFLTLTAIEDTCAKRRAAMSRVWVHSLSAVTDGGLGVMSFGTGWLKATVPHMQFGLSGDGYNDLRATDGTDHRLVAMTDPSGIDAPCGATRQPVTIEKTPAAFVAYIRTFPGFTVATEQSTVAGLPATHVTITPKGSATCQADGSIVAFHSQASGATGEFSISADQAHSMWIVQDVSGNTDLFLYGGDAVTPAEETSVISSLELLDALPTP